ncbi:MAG: aminoacyl-tRNA hydrolase [Candidatus Zixiibacteriota bacterium]
MPSIIIGLGNIGRKYRGTRHNLGFELLDAIAAQWNLKAVPGDGDYYIVEKELEGKLIRLVWPTTYMNNSGKAAEQVLQKFLLTPRDLLVVYDDLNLPLGRLRIRSEGSDGGHNGMADIIYHLGTEEIARLRLGIGPLPPGVDTVSFVLNPFADNELEIKKKMLEKAGEAVLYLLKFDIAKAMSIYNPAPDEAQ